MQFVKVLGLIWFALACGDAKEVASSTASDTAAQPQSGEKVFNQYCFSCHAAGVAGAPRIGEKEDWQPRIALGRETMMRNIIEGMPPAMPTKGLCNQCSTEELSAALDFMLATLDE